MHLDKGNLAAAQVNVDYTRITSPIDGGVGLRNIDPGNVATAITAPLERQLGEVPGLSQMLSSSSDGASVITLQFNSSLSIDVTEQDVQEAINVAQSYLPTNLPMPPVYDKVNPANAPILAPAPTSVVP